MEVDFTVENLESVSDCCCYLLPEVDILKCLSKPKKKKKSPEKLRKLNITVKQCSLAPDVRAQMIEADLL